MAALLINGNGFEEVSAQRDADFYEGIFGKETCILAVGQKMSAAIVNNSPRIYDGVILTKEGRRIQIDYGTYQDFTIPTGTAGQTAYYIIGFKLSTGSDDKQTCEPFVRSMDSPSATITENMLKNGNAEVYVSVYRVKQVGTTNTLGECLISTANTMNRTPIYASLADLGSSSKMYISRIFNSMTDGSIAILNQDAINGLPYSGAIGTAFIIRNTSTNGGCFFLTGTGYPNYKCNRDNTGGTWERLPCDSDIFYKENETITLRLCTGGFLAGGGRELWVSAPTNRKLHSGRNLNLVSGKFIVRQNGGYLTTPSASYVDINTEMTDFSVYENEIVFIITNDSGWGGTHNDAVGVEGFIKVIEV